jgi:hypothetical protein
MIPDMNATCVTHDGLTIFGAIPNNRTGRLVDGNVEPLGSFLAYAASDDGSIVAGYAVLPVAPHYHPILWTPTGGVTSLPTLLGDGSGAATSMTADGSLRIGYSSSQYCVWPASGGVVTVGAYLQGFGISTTDWTNFVVEGMNGDGSVMVGHGDHNGQHRAFVIRLRPNCGSSDYNHDGDVGTDQDIDAFFACLAGNCCSGCYTADFNGDGDVGTDADIEAFFRVLGGEAC